MRILLAAPLAAVLVLGVSTPVAAAGNHGNQGHHGDGGYARHAPRPGVTDQDFYFVMGDRFANGDPANDQGGLTGDRLVTGFDPTGKGFYNGGDLDGLRVEAGLHPGPRHRRDLADADLQEQGGPARGRALGRLPRLLDHRLHPGRPAPRHQPGPRRARRRRARPWDEGLLRHHHQPHRGRDRLQRGRPHGVRLEGRLALPRRASGEPFDDRDYAGTGAFPTLDPATSFPYHPVLGAGRGEPQGPGLAQRRDDVPQPRQHDLHRRGQPVRRLLRPRRPLHRAARGGRRDGRHLPDLGRGLRHRRLPDRHDEARQRRVLAAVRARPCRPSPPRTATRTSSCSARSPSTAATPRPRASPRTTRPTTEMQAILDFPFQDAARGFASQGLDNQRLAEFFANDDWYTDRDSNVY